MVFDFDIDPHFTSVFVTGIFQKFVEIFFQEFLPVISGGICADIFQEVPSDIPILFYPIIGLEIS